MALIWFAGPSIVGQGESSTNAMQTGYADAASQNIDVSETDRRDANPYLNTDGNENLRVHVPLDTTFLVVGFACIAGNVSGNDYQTLMRVSAGDSTLDGRISFQLQWAPRTGYLRVQTATGTNAIGVISNPSSRLWFNRGWHYVEAKINITSGAWEIRVNNVTLATGTDTLDAVNSEVDRVMFNSSEITGFADMYILDDQGTLNVDFLGDSICRGIVPNGAGDSTQWTPDSGNNWERVDETGDPDAASYVESSTDGQVDLYTFTDLGGVNDVRGVHILAHAQNTGMGNAKLIFQAKHNGNTASSIAHRLGQKTSMYYRSIFEVDPDGNTQWLAGDVAVSQFGIEVELP